MFFPLSMTGTSPHIFGAKDERPLLPSEIFFTL